MSTFRLAVSYLGYYGLGQRPPIPNWLYGDISHLSRNGHSFNYWTKIYWATPPFFTRQMYAEMKKIYGSARGDEHVDHIVPLKHPEVCGLHVPWNLRVINEKKNLVKSNNLWPDAWNQQSDLFLELGEELPCEMYKEFYSRKKEEPIQLRLPWVFNLKQLKLF